MTPGQNTVISPESLTVSGALPGFLQYLWVERRFSRTTVKTYEYSVRFFIREVGDLPIRTVGLEHVISLKAHLTARGARESRIAGVLAALKCLLQYSRDVRKIQVLDTNDIKLPRPPRREVIYLTNEELEQFLAAIPLRTWTGKHRLAGFRFRALCEAVVATGMRLSEALSLDRNSVEMETRTATIVGKRNKQRTVFFTNRALHWLTRYLDLRTDKGEALFACESGARLRQKAVQAMFSRTGRWAGLEKPVTAHILRHTTATNLLKNGCPIGHIKEILGHENLETTCRYYLGLLSKKEVQQAHATYLDIEVLKDETRTPHAAPPATLKPSTPPRPHGPFDSSTWSGRVETNP